MQKSLKKTEKNLDKAKTQKDQNMFKTTKMQKPVKKYCHKFV